MPCECYKQALIDAAAAGESPSRELAAHLSACSACRAAFATEQQLLAAIGSGLRTAANSEVPASLFPRVRERLDAQRVSRFGWMKAGLVFAAALLMLGVTGALLRGLHRESRGADSLVSTAARKSVPEEIPTPAARAPLAPMLHSAAPAIPRAARKHNGPDAERDKVRNTEAAVLVPAGQRAAVDALLVALRRGTVKSDGLLAENSGQRPADNTLLRLAVPEMEITPLPVISPEAASDGKTTRF